MEIVSRKQVAIIGAGIAGAASAYFLVLKGIRNVAILEREKVEGSLSTARNAAILRSAIPDPVIRSLARLSAGFYQHPPEGFSSNPLLKPVGLYLVARSEHAQALVSWAVDGVEGEGAKEVDPAELYRRVPLLAPGIAVALHDPEEGILDIHGILQSFLTGARREGVEILLTCDATRLQVDGNRVAGVMTSRGLIEAENVVMAGGGYAAALAEASGFPLPLAPYRRHLIVTNPLSQVDPGWPVVWCEGDEFYFRPESGGLLMCGCDTVLVPPEEGQKTDPAQIEHIAQKASRWLPALGNAGVARAWSGMRTFAPDHRFVIGPDPRLHGLYWAAGLGGHGMTCAPGAGQLLADWVAGASNRHPAAQSLLPDRLLQSAAERRRAGVSQRTVPRSPAS